MSSKRISSSSDISSGDSNLGASLAAVLWAASQKAVTQSVLSHRSVPEYWATLILNHQYPPHHHNHWLAGEHHNLSERRKYNTRQPSHFLRPPLPCDQYEPQLLSELRGHFLASESSTKIVSVCAAPLSGVDTLVTTSLDILVKDNIQFLKEEKRVNYWNSSWLF